MKIMRKFSKTPINRVRVSGNFVGYKSTQRRLKSKFYYVEIQANSLKFKVFIVPFSFIWRL